MPHLNPKAKLAMRQAWAEARRGQRIYGGSVRQYLREALRLAWIDIKAHPVTRAADELIRELRAKRAAGYVPKAPTPYLARFANVTRRHVWADSRL